jgi:hypothetical protein
MSLVATPGASNANSYATVAEADAYHATRLHSETWLDATASEKTAALIMATRLLDAFYSNPAINHAIGTVAPPKNTIWAWTGTASTSTQVLCWPRIGMLNRNGFAIDSAIIPQELKDAVSEFGWQLLGTDRTLDNEIDSKGITQVTAGPITLKFKEDQYSKVMPDAVQGLLVPSWIVYIYGTLPAVFQVL